MPGRSFVAKTKRQKALLRAQFFVVGIFFIHQSVFSTMGGGRNQMIDTSHEPLHILLMRGCFLLLGCLGLFEAIRKGKKPNRVPVTD